MKRFVSLIFPCFVFLIFSSGCKTVSPNYYWGKYEPLSYGTLAKPNTVSIEEQIVFLEKDLQIAASKNLPVPPGFHAYLGYLYLENGDSENGIKYLNNEKLFFPESTDFIDQLLDKIVAPLPQPE